VREGTPSAALDPDTEARSRPHVIEGLLAAATTRVVLADPQGRLALYGDRLDVLTGPVAADLYVYLGKDPHGDAHVLALGPEHPGREYRDLRIAVHELPEAERAVAVPAVAMAQWHRLHPHCPRCGTVTRVSEAGWVRLCPACGTEHHPRTDPAVIVAVVDDADRLLLAHAAHFPAGRWSVIAGYVEPGESLERAVVREVREEVAIEVDRVRYRGSQPWPFPRSLMCAFVTRAPGAQEPRVDGREILAARFFTRAALAEAVAAGDLTLPGPASVASALVAAWMAG